MTRTLDILSAAYKRIDALQTERDALVARVAELEAENLRLREHIAALEKEARKLVAQIERLAETIETPERNRGGECDERQLVQMP